MAYDDNNYDPDYFSGVQAGSREGGLPNGLLGMSTQDISNTNQDILSAQFPSSGGGQSWEDRINTQTFTPMMEPRIDTTGPRINTTGYAGNNYVSSPSWQNQTRLNPMGDMEKAWTGFGSRMSGGGSFGMAGSPIHGGGGDFMGSLQAAIAEENKAREEAQKRALADRSQAISGQQSAKSASLSALQPAKSLATTLMNNPEVLTGAIKNYILGRVFDRIDLDTASAESMLAQRYAQTGRSANPAVLQRLRDTAMMEKANQGRELEIAAALQNRASTESATRIGLLEGEAEAGVHQKEADAIGQYLENTKYLLPNNLQNFAQVASTL